LTALAVLAMRIRVIVPFAVIVAGVAVLSDTKSAHLWFLLVKYCVAGAIAMTLAASTVNTVLVSTLSLLAIVGIFSYKRMHINKMGEAKLGMGIWGQ
ncbi:MAG: hypothetical protein P8123_08090, partial [bacterium]